MTKTKSIYLALLTILLAPASAFADIIDFDDLTPADGVFIPQGYNGFSWLGAAGTSSWVNEVAAPLGIPCNSGPNCSWSNGGARLDLTDGVFSIQSLWIYARSGDNTINLSGSFGGSEVYSASIDVAGGTWTLLTLNFFGIDTFSLDSSIEANLLVDDIRFNVPEPGTLALLGLGLVGMAAARRRRKV